MASTLLDTPLPPRVEFERRRMTPVDAAFAALFVVNFIVHMGFGFWSLTAVTVESRLVAVGNQSVPLLRC